MGRTLVARVGPASQWIDICGCEADVGVGPDQGSALAERPSQGTIKHHFAALAFCDRPHSRLLLAAS